MYIFQEYVQLDQTPMNVMMVNVLETSMATKHVMVTQTVRMEVMRGIVLVSHVLVVMYS